MSFILIEYDKLSKQILVKVLNLTALNVNPHSFAGGTFGLSLLFDSAEEIVFLLA